MQIFKTPNYNFIKWRWHALILSALVIIAGIGLMVARGGLPLGIDFSGGTQIVIKFSQSVSQRMVLDAIEGIPGEKVVQQYDDPADNSRNESGQHAAHRNAGRWGRAESGRRLERHAVDRRRYSSG